MKRSLNEEDILRFTSKKWWTLLYVDCMCILYVINVNMICMFVFVLISWPLPCGQQKKCKLFERYHISSHDMDYCTCSISRTSSKSCTLNFEFWVGHQSPDYEILKTPPMNKMGRESFQFHSLSPGRWGKYFYKRFFQIHFMNLYLGHSM